MQRDPLNNIHIQSEQVMITPAQLSGETAHLRSCAGIRARGSQHHRRHHPPSRSPPAGDLWPLLHPRLRTLPKSTQPDSKAPHDAYQDSLHCQRGSTLRSRAPRSAGAFYQRSEPGRHLRRGAGAAPRPRAALAGWPSWSCRWPPEALRPHQPAIPGGSFPWSAIGACTTESQTH